MGRSAVARTAAEPTSPVQVARAQRIIKVATAHAAAHGLEGMQMADVARDAGVAIGTLYRYFPGKIQLLGAVMRAQVMQLETRVRRIDGEDPVEAVSGLLGDTLTYMVGRRTLFVALLQAVTNLGVVENSDIALDVDDSFARMVMDLVGLERDDPDDAMAVVLLLKCWFGIMQGALSGRTDLPGARKEIALACQRLLPQRVVAPVDTTALVAGA